MNRRDRIKRTLNHQEPDRIPIDLGSTLCSGIHRLAYLQFAKYLNIEINEPIIHDIMQQLALPDEKILKYLDVDFRGIFPGGPDNNTEVFLDDGTWIDEWGVYREKPSSAFYYDMVKSPLENDETSFRDIEKFNWPDPNDSGRIRGLKDKAQYMRNNTDYGIVLNYQAVFVHISQYMRGFKGWYEDLLINQKRVCELFDRILDFYLKFGEHLFREVGQYADVVICSDDISGQNGPLFSPKLYRELIKPRQAKLFDFVHKQTEAKLMFHTCGTVLPFMEDLIEIGVDIINPVQVTAKGMDTRVLKEKYGDKISFWGGIDTQNVLPFGNVEDVRNEVEKRIFDLGRNGGYVLGAVHNIQPKVKPENILTMFSYAKEFGKYPLK
ncbi:MAG: uroporphyrinogen decarboxylase family protein [Candidatus Humimicrobiaceae bacterium]